MAQVINLMTGLTPLALAAYCIICVAATYLLRVACMAFGAKNVSLWQLPISIIAFTGDGFVPFCVLTELDTLSYHCLAFLNLKR